MSRAATIQWHHQILNEVETYLCNHYAEPFGIRHLADQVHLSYHHLAEIFLHYRRESLGSYLVRKKMEQAASLYAYTCLGLSEIADQTGYSTKHSLSKAFTQHFGLSPGCLAKRSLYQEESPNIVHDGIDSAEQYQSLLASNFSFAYKVVVLENCYLSGKLYAGNDPEADALAKKGEGYFLKAFDSINFSPLDSFRMFGGQFHHSIDTPATLAQLYSRSSSQLVLPVKAGRYGVFSIPPGTVMDRQRNITICRERLVLREQVFVLKDFFDFFLFSNQGGEYYMHLG